MADSSEAKGESKGAVFVATGPAHYARLAARAAESLKLHLPWLPVDLYADKAYDFPVFDRVHVLEDPWIRSKIDALARSRFERTLYLDSDIVVIADIRDIFEVLDRFDIALTHDQQRNGMGAQLVWRLDLPAGFPQFSGGLVALRRNRGTQRMLADWAAAVRDHGIGRDQPALREVLWNSDLRIATLPEEYNLMRFHTLLAWDRQQAAPRIIHSPQFHREFERYMATDDPVTERLGLRKAWHVRWLQAMDRALARQAGREPAALSWQARFAWQFRRLPSRLWRRLLHVGLRR